ncbi:hypothetical protein JZ751_016003 [Albula glossodonta]|uniref:Uncharacterized protein n=1 Tax=Albula glossodonta TaxID=121402 RepID=A0A8T2NYS3_9TELE|nr:hypothetical protein JZ751_016003 [Albula glossodonta]
MEASKIIRTQSAGCFRLELRSDLKFDSESTDSLLGSLDLGFREGGGVISTGTKTHPAGQTAAHNLLINSVFLHREATEGRGGIPSDDPHAGDHIFLAILIIMTVLGNLLVMVALCKDRHLRLVAMVTDVSAHVFLKSCSGCFCQVLSIAFAALSLHVVGDRHGGVGKNTETGFHELELYREGVHTVVGNLEWVIQGQPAVSDGALGYTTPPTPNWSGPTTLPPVHNNTTEY